VAFLRFSRDRRGYENTFLLHAVRPRDEKERPRLLYWFRTPPHLKVGRTPFDDDAIRTLEEEHPEVEFDWSRLLESPAAASADWNGSPGDASNGQHKVPPDASSTDAGDPSPGSGPRRRRRWRGPGA
jgi:hypothetical protein